MINALRKCRNDLGFFLQLEIDFLCFISSKQGYLLLQDYLRTFEGAQANELEQAKLLAVDAAVQAIKLEDIHQFDELLELQAIKQVGNLDFEKILYFFCLVFIFVFN
jgi:hypothetical protein